MKILRFVSLIFLPIFILSLASSSPSYGGRSKKNKKQTARAREALQSGDSAAKVLKQYGSQLPKNVKTRLERQARKERKYGNSCSALPQDIQNIMSGLPGLIPVEISTGNSILTTSICTPSPELDYTQIVTPGSGENILTPFQSPYVFFSNNPPQSMQGRNVRSLLNGRFRDPRYLVDNYGPHVSEELREELERLAGDAGGNEGAAQEPTTESEFSIDPTSQQTSLKIIIWDPNTTQNHLPGLIPPHTPSDWELITYPPQIESGHTLTTPVILGDPKWDSLFSATILANFVINGDPGDGVLIQPSPFISDEEGVTYTQSSPGFLDRMFKGVEDFTVKSVGIIVDEAGKVVGEVKVFLDENPEIVVGGLATVTVGLYIYSCFNPAALKFAIDATKLTASVAMAAYVSDSDSGYCAITPTQQEVAIDCHPYSY